MVARLGDVLYWLGSIIAVVLWALVVVGLVWGTGASDPIGVIFLGGLGVIAWVVGRACRYVMAGR